MSAKSSQPYPRRQCARFCRSILKATQKAVLRGDFRRAEAYLNYLAHELSVIREGEAR